VRGELLRKGTGCSCEEIVIKLNQPTYAWDGVWQTHPGSKPSSPPLQRGGLGSPGLGVRVPMVCGALEQFPLSPSVHRVLIALSTRGEAPRLSPARVHRVFLAAYVGRQEHTRVRARNAHSGEDIMQTLPCERRRKLGTGILANGGWREVSGSSSVAGAASPRARRGPRR
jgi:hypothetical protein